MAPFAHSPVGPGARLVLVAACAGFGLLSESCGIVSSNCAEIETCLPDDAAAGSETSPGNVDGFVTEADAGGSGEGQAGSDGGVQTDSREPDAEGGLVDGNVPDVRFDATPPDGASRDATLSDGAHQDAMVSDGASPDATLSDGASPDATLSDGASPDATLSDGASPDATLSDGASPDATLSDGGHQDATVPDGASPDATDAADEGMDSASDSANSGPEGGFGDAADLDGCSRTVACASGTSCCLDLCCDPGSVCCITAFQYSCLPSCNGT